MSTLPEIHLCIQQPPGYVHSLGLLDQARYFRYQFRRLGGRVSLSKNRLRHDAVNFVFGAHLGFAAAQRERHACVFVNLEQLGQGGAAVSADYLRLLTSSAVVDYDAQNVATYATRAEDVTVVPLLHAPYLKPEQNIALEERPIDLLFIGSMNARRRGLGSTASRPRACRSRPSTGRCTAPSATNSSFRPRRWSMHTSMKAAASSRRGWRIACHWARR